MALTAYKTVAMFMRHVYIEMQALVSLDQHVEIVVQPARRAHSACITVAG